MINKNNKKIQHKNTLPVTSYDPDLYPREVYRLLFGKRCEKLS